MTFLNTDTKIATHAAITTNVHGTGAGNVIVGNDEISGMLQQSFGSYTGNHSVNRAIPHSLSNFALVIITDNNLNRMYLIRENSDYIAAIMASSVATSSVTTPNATNFYVGNAGSYGTSANDTDVAYSWIAFG